MKHIAFLLAMFATGCDIQLPEESFPDLRGETGAYPGLTCDDSGYWWYKQQPVTDQYGNQLSCTGMPQ